MPAATSSSLSATPSPATADTLAGGSIAYQGPIPGGAGIRIVGTDGIGDQWLFPDVKLPKDRSKVGATTRAQLVWILAPRLPEPDDTDLDHPGPPP